MRCFLATILVAFFSFVDGEAEALTATGSFNVQVAITATCVVTSATTLDFGTQGVLSANVDQTSTINVTCTNTTPYNIALLRYRRRSSQRSKNGVVDGPSNTR